MNGAPARPVTLAHRAFGAGPPLVLVHGLFGSGRNWQSLARHLSRHWRVLLPDLRNHGESPHDPRMDWPAVLADLQAFAAAQALPPCPWLGHSLGGRAVMQLALRHPERMRSLLVLDSAPVAATAAAFEPVFEALQALPLAPAGSRAELDALLAHRLEDPALRQFLLSALVREGQAWRWRNNLPVLRAALPGLLAFPWPARATCPLPALFLAGGRSAWRVPRHAACIRERFPASRLQVIADAGHWLHAEQPAAVLQAVEAFLAAH